MRNHADAVISHSTVCNKAANSVYRSPKFYISGACLRINTLRHGGYYETNGIYNEQAEPCQTR